MARKLANLASMSVTGTPGTSDFTLDTASADYNTFANAGVLDGDVVTYAAYESGVGREVGEGTYQTSGPTLVRTRVIESTNSDAKVSFGSGVVVFVTASSEDIIGRGKILATALGYDMN